MISTTAVCGAFVGPEQGFQLSSLIAEDIAEGFSAIRPDELTDSVLLTIAPSDQTDSQTDPVVTGTGNEEIWRDRREDDK